jgi:hypothetical protein
MCSQLLLSRDRKEHAMRIEFAYIPGTSRRAIGVVVTVRPQVLDDRRRAEEIRAELGQVQDFRGLPVILAARAGGNRIRYHGDPSLVRQLARIDGLALPWRTATLAA